VTCIGDERAYSYLPSRARDALSKQAAKHVLRHIEPQFVSYSWLDRGSDERQYFAPGVDLPIATIMRSKYGEYPEYHTSLDDFNLVTPAGLKGGYLALKLALEVIEQNVFPKITVLGEPQLGKRGLYPYISIKSLGGGTQALINHLTYCGGKRTPLEIADLIGQPMWDLLPLVE
jgi:aminopeptidase-like protein